jgi:hypothetical protein
MLRWRNVNWLLDNLGDCSNESVVSSSNSISESVLVKELVSKSCSEPSAKRPGMF